MPTQLPTLSIETQWTNKLKDLLKVSSLAVKSSVSRQSAYFELDNLDDPSNKHASSCGSWSSLNNDVCADRCISLQPYFRPIDSTINLGCRCCQWLLWFHSYMQWYQKYYYFNSIHDRPTIIKSLLRVECGGSTWVANYCDSFSGNKLPSLCLNCLDPCSANARCLDNTYGALYTVAPCVSKKCDTTFQMSPIIRILSIQFSDIQSAPTINRVSTSALKYSIRIVTT